MSTEAAAAAQRRIVPGAPPPPALTKTQKKKRRAAKKEGVAGGAVDSEPDTPATNNVVLPDTHAAALTEKAPGQKDMKSGAVVDELFAKRSTTPAAPASEAPRSEAGGDAGGSVIGSAKSSPVVDLLNKRLKALGKKITRIHMYSGKPHSELNDDQKKTLATLPSLEAVRKELEEVRKAVETLESEQARDTALARAAAEEAESQRVAEAVAEAQREHAERTARVMDFIRFHSLLSNADPTVQALNLVEAEINAIYASTNALLALEMESKLAVLNGLLRGEGEIEGVPYGRLLDILDAHSRPTTEEVAEEVAEAVAEAIAEAVSEQAEQTDITPVVTGIPNTSGKMSFRFMQESELDGDGEGAGFENGAEWVDKEEAPQQPPEVNVTVVQETFVVEQPVEPEALETPANGGLNWADDEGELPSIDGLHRTFGTSGPGAPADQQAESAKEPAGPNEAANATPNGHVQAASGEDDGFMQARGGRGRGRGRVFRGAPGERGGYRGGDRGFRGRGGGRGRPYQGSDSNNWRSPSEGGEQRGPRGRGRGRGGFDRDRGGAPRGGRGGGGNNNDE